MNELKNILKEEDLLEESIGLNEVDSEYEDEEGIDDSDSDFDRRWYGQ